MYQHSTQPMPEVAKKLIYKNDLKSAVARLDNCWNSTQLEDALTSIKFFIQKMEK